MNWAKTFTATAVLAGSLSMVCEALEEPKGDAIWQAVHENSCRLEQDSARDQYRHPEEFLRFLGLEPTMTVAEVNPGGGWYSRVLAPFLKDQGRYVGLEHHPDYYANNKKYQQTFLSYPAKIEANRDMYGDRAIGTWIPAKDGLPVEANSLDAVIIVRALHNWYRRGFFDKGLEQLHAVMKPGAVLGVVQHRADPDFKGDIRATTGRGRWKEEALIAAIEAHGFKLVARSEMNANPKDTKDYPEGVWTLPPSLDMGDEDREKYIAIGESDRMTLKFVKAEQP